MMSAICEKAVSEALQFGNAILKFISPNDVNVTGAHQTGFYLPKAVWEMYTPNAPTKGQNSKHDVSIEWQDGLKTQSVVTWYGQGTRSEYRLTRFGRGFPYLIPDNVGDLLVLIPKSLSEFSAYVLDLEEDIEEIMAALGVQPFERWAVYRNGAATIIEDTDECLERLFQGFASKYSNFPAGQIFSDAVHEMLAQCLKEIGTFSADDRLTKYYETEYRLFRLVERQICQSEIGRLFKDVDDFLKTAASIMNRRKSRAGHSLENHVDYILEQSKIPHEMQPDIDGKPDIVIPNHDAYLDKTFPLEKLFIVGVKTTCKDRWRQVLNEGKRVPNKHILTLQQGISTNQLTEMHKAGVTLIVPKNIQSDYPSGHSLTILSVEDFMSSVKRTMA
jgi:type II restriction enzyme